MGQTHALDVRAPYRLRRPAFRWPSWAWLSSRNEGGGLTLLVVGGLAVCLAFPGILGVSKLTGGHGAGISHSRAHYQCSAAQINEAKVYAKGLSDKKFGASQWGSLQQLWTGESQWCYKADNHSSSAYGIPQALPGSKMGGDWRSDWRLQIRWGLNYIKGRYGTPSRALRAWNGRHPHWY